MINKQAFLHGYLATKEKATPYLIKIAANIDDIDLGEILGERPDWAQGNWPILDVQREANPNVISRHLRAASEEANKRGASIPTDVASINRNPGLTGVGTQYGDIFYENFRPMSIKERIYNYLSIRGQNINKSLPEFMQPMGNKFLSHVKAQDIKRYLRGYSAEELSEAGRSKLTQARELAGKQIFDDAVQNRNLKNLFKNYFKENVAYYKQFPRHLLKTPLARYGGGAALGTGAIYGGWKLGESLFGNKPQPKTLTFADRIRNAIQRIQR